MATLPHITTNPGSETASTSETAVGGQAAASLLPKDTSQAEANRSDGQTETSPPEKKGMSAEEAAERVYAERMEDEYAKREGGA